MRSSPFKFLDSYTKEDKEIFFGREHEIEELYSRVFQSKLLLVYGLSGTGKSSLIHCGLSNKFNDSDWLPIVVRRAENINTSLLRTLKKNALTPLESPEGTKKPLSVKKVLNSLYLDHFKPIYLVFDQFEELFIFGTDEEKETFVKEVAAIVSSEIKCKFIFVIREEYLATLTEFEEFLPDLFSNRLRIEKMTRLKAKEVVEKPCEVFKIGLEPGFADSLLQKLSPDKNEVELTYLQVYLDKIYRLSSGKQGVQGAEGITFTNKVLDSTGSITDILGSFLEEQIAQLANPEEALTLLKAFVSTQGTKRQIDISEAADFARTLGKNIDQANIKSLITQFVDLRILRDKDENGRYELRHDALALKIYEEITLAEKELLEVRQFIESAFSTYQKRNILLSHEDLSYIAPYKDKLFLSEDLSAFILASRRQISQKKRRTRNLAIAAGIVLLSIFAGFTFWALNERHTAIIAMRDAEIQKNEAVAAKEAAELATKRALHATEEANNSKTIAETEKEKATKATYLAVQANKSTKEALLVAEANRITAEKEKKNSEASKEKAIAEKEKADKNRLEAEKAEKKSSLLSIGTISQKLALKATLEFSNKELQGLLAVQAYKFNDQINGLENDANIFQGLLKSMPTNLGADYNLYKPVQTVEPKILDSGSDGSLISVSNNGLVYSWDPKAQRLNGSKQLNLSGLTPVIYWNEFSSGKYFISGHDDNSIVLWVLENNKYRRIDFPKNHLGILRGAVFNSSFTSIYTGSKDGKIIKWKFDGKITFVKDLTVDSEVSTLCLAGNKIAYSLKSGKGGLLSEDLEVSSFGTDESPGIAAYAYDKEHKMLYGGSVKGTVLVIDMGKGNKVVKEMTVAKSSIKFICIDSKTKYLVVADNEKRVSIFDLQNLTHEPKKVMEHVAMIRSLYCNAGKIYVGFSDYQIREWDIENAVMKNRLCAKLPRPMTETEWDNYIGKDIKFQNSCANE